MKTAFMVGLLAAASAFVPGSAFAAQQLISFGGELNYGSVWGSSPYGSPGTQLQNKKYTVQLAYDPTLFTNTGTCGSVPSNQCNFQFTPTRIMTATFTVDGTSQSYVWTNGEFYLSAGGNDQFGFNFNGSAGSFSGSFGDGNSFYPNQNSVNTPILANFTNLAVTGGQFQFNRDGFGFGDNPSTLTSSFTAAAPAVPEPATWAMMLVGFGFVGGAMRAAKRRQSAKLAYT